MDIKHVNSRGENCFGFLEIHSDATLKCDECGQSFSLSEHLGEYIHDTVDGYHSGQLEIIEQKQDALIKILEVILKSMGK